MYGIYTGDLLTRKTPPDDTCPSCGSKLIEIVDDGTRWRLSWEMISAITHSEFYDGDRPRPHQGVATNEDIPDSYWHTTVKEHANEFDARDQWEGLHTLIEQGEFIRNVKIEKSAVTWEEVDW